MAKHTCTCHHCNKEYETELTPEESEILFANYDPTDYVCPECEEAESAALEAQIQFLDSLIQEEEDPT